MNLLRSLVLSVAVVVALSSAPVAAQAKPIDLTGVWMGTLTPTGGYAGGAYLDLKQKGAELTGTAGQAPDRQTAIANGKVTTVKGETIVTFDITQSNGRILKFSLKVVEGRLKGSVTTEADGQKRDAALDVERQK